MSVVLEPAAATARAEMELTGSHVPFKVADLSLAE